MFQPSNVVQDFFHPQYVTSVLARQIILGTQSGMGSMNHMIARDGMVSEALPSIIIHH